MKGHLWHPDQDQPQVRDWVREGSRERYTDAETWLLSYRRWMQGWEYLIGEHGLNAGVYTQIADVEHETNGWLTYDREISKIPVETLRTLHSELYKPPLRVKPLVAERPNEWRYSTVVPSAGWEEHGFDDSRWATGAAPSQANEVWLRRKFSLDRLPRSFAVRALGRGAAEVWINGTLARALNHQGSRSGDIQVTIQPVWPESGAALRQGDNLIAVRAFAKGGPVSVEIRLVELEARPCSHQSRTRPRCAPFSTCR